jgi:DNA-binding MarR family transcriptional regulator
MNSRIELLADRMVFTAAALTRWLKIADTAALLTGPQASALSVIVLSRSIRPSELARLEEVRRPTISRTVRQLIDMKLVSRVDNPQDARSVLLEATPDGVAVIRRGHERRIQPLCRTLERASEIELITLERATHIIDSIIE